MERRQTTTTSGLRSRLAVGEVRKYSIVRLPIELK